MATEFSIVHWTGKAPEQAPKVKKPKPVPVAQPVMTPEPVVPTVDAASLFATIKPPEQEIAPISEKPVLPPLDEDLPPLYLKPVEQDALSRTTDPLVAKVEEIQPEAGKAGRGRRAYRSGRGT